MPKNSNERNVDTGRLSPIGYHYAHTKLFRARGRARDYQCAVCEQQASQWAYRGDSEYEQHETYEKVARQGGPQQAVRRWSADVYAYDPLCVPCHIARDKEART